MHGGGSGLLNGVNNSACIRTFAGHQNQKNFVGMSVSADGHIACGSEDNTVCLYARCVPTPISKKSLAASAFQSNVSPGFGQGGAGGGAGSGAGGGATDKPGLLFVSSIAWSPDGRRLIAANSCGAVKVLEVVH
jgi:WD40 repeat protein